jgi:hypothetical protein
MRVYADEENPTDWEYFEAAINEGKFTYQLSRGVLLLGKKVKIVQPVHTFVVYILRK